MVKASIDIDPLGGFSDYFFRPESLGFGNLLMDGDGKGDEILAIDVEKREFYVLELLLVFDNEAGIVHEIVRLSISFGIFLVVDTKRLALEEVIIELPLELLKLVEGLVNFGVDLPFCLFLHLLQQRGVRVSRRIQILHTINNN